MLFYFLTSLRPVLLEFPKLRHIINPNIIFIFFRDF